jgi:anti-sigma factor RsiW
MKANPNIDELLCSFVDGELPLRQQTEVQRLAARDPEVGRRLRRLQNARTLISGLPRAEAPGDLLEQVKLALERKTLLEEQPTAGVSTAGVIHLMARRLVAAAAMIVLLGALGFVVYQILAPVPGGNVAGPVAFDQPAISPVAVADAGFSGRLEIRTAAVAQAEAVLTRAIEENGLSRFVESSSAAGASTYRLVGSRQAASRLVASLQSVWQKSDGVTLRIEGKGENATPVTVEAVTPEQAVSIIASENTAATLETARNYAVMNAVAQRMPGREVLAMVHNDAAGAQDLVKFDDTVRMAGPKTDSTLAEPQGEMNANLTIILLRTR